MMRCEVLIFCLLIPLLSCGQKLKTITKKNYQTNAVEIQYTVLKKQSYVKHGEYKKIFPNGQVEEIGIYNNNKKTGDWKEYNYIGELRRVRKYEKGKLVSNHKYGIWKEIGKNKKPYFYNYDTEERAMPQIYIIVNYPSEERENRIEGTVIVKIKLDEQCLVREKKIVKSLGTNFDREAIKGVENFIDKLKSYEDDCKGFEKSFNIDFKIE